MVSATLPLPLTVDSTTVEAGTTIYADLNSDGGFSRYGGGGGGSSDIATCAHGSSGCTLTGVASTDPRLVVAGGGGGAGEESSDRSAAGGNGGDAGSGGSGPTSGFGGCGTNGSAGSCIGTGVTYGGNAGYTQGSGSSGLFGFDDYPECFAVSGGGGAYGGAGGGGAGGNTDNAANGGGGGGGWIGGAGGGTGGESGDCTYAGSGIGGGGGAGLSYVDNAATSLSVYPATTIAANPWTTVADPCSSHSSVPACVEITPIFPPVAASDSVRYSSSGTYTVPSGVADVDVTVIGAAGSTCDGCGTGGRGAEVEATVPVGNGTGAPPGTTLYANINSDGGGPYLGGGSSDFSLAEPGGGRTGGSGDYRLVVAGGGGAGGYAGGTGGNAGVGGLDETSPASSGWGGGGTVAFPIPFPDANGGTAGYTTAANGQSGEVGLGSIYCGGSGGSGTAASGGSGEVLSYPGGGGGGGWWGGAGGGAGSSSPCGTPAGAGGGGAGLSYVESPATNVSVFSAAVSAADPCGSGAACIEITPVFQSAVSTSEVSSSSVTGDDAYDTFAGAGGCTLDDCPTPTGTVTFYYYEDGSCTSPVSNDTWPDAVPLSGGAAQSASTGQLLHGYYSFAAVYSGDQNYLGSTSGCEPFTVSLATPSLGTAVHNGSGGLWDSTSETTGVSAYDTSSLGDLVSGYTPGGTVTYSFYKNGGCSGTATATSGALALGTASPTEGPLGGGSYSFQASYSGDTNYYDPATSACEDFTVARATPSFGTAVANAASGDAWGSSQVTGASAEDTASVGGVTNFSPTGTVTYDFYTNGTCDGTGTTDTVTLDGGAVPDSTATGPLAVGSYSFEASYNSGSDPNYDSVESSGCEPFSVSKAVPTVSVTVDDVATGASWSGNEVTGAAALASSVVSNSAGPYPTGTLTYTLYDNGTCTNTGTNEGTVTLYSNGAAPNADQVGPLAAGSYSYGASYNPGSDPNYDASTGCKPFTVKQATPSNSGEALTQVVYNGATDASWASSPGVTGATAYDLASFAGTAGGIPPTGTVTYKLYSTASGCTGTPTATSTESIGAAAGLPGGVVPPSASSGALQEGSYDFQSVYSGDSNYATATSVCSPFSVAQATGRTAEQIYDAGTNELWAGTEVTNASAYAIAAVAGNNGIAPTGTVDYTFYANGSCSPDGTTATDQSLSTSSLNPSDSVAPQSATEGPLEAGIPGTSPPQAITYSLGVVYTGDKNYAGSSACEPFHVSAAPQTVGSTVWDPSLGGPWDGSEVTGSTAYDVATVPAQLVPADGPATLGSRINLAHIVEDAGAQPVPPTGTITYTFYDNSDCTGSGTGEGTVTLGTGAALDSSTVGPLAAGSYGFVAVYSGDVNYDNATSSCAPFDVGLAPSTLDTTVDNAASNQAWGTAADTAAETTGASAFDTAALSGTSIAPSGDVSFTFFDNGTCAGTGGTSAGTSADETPTSEGPLAAGTYSFEGTYAGDSNYYGSTSCTSFTVGQATPGLSVAPLEAGGDAWGTTPADDVTGSAASAGSTITPPATTEGVAALVPGGSVTYDLYDNTGATPCTGKLVWSDSEALSGGSVPDAAKSGALGAGTYWWQATYGGDPNYLTSSSACTSFVVGPESVVQVQRAFDVPLGQLEQTGSQAYDTLTLTGVSGFTPAGTVTYNLYDGNTCTTIPVTGTSWPDVVNVSSSGAVPSSADSGPLAAGTYSFEATYDDAVDNSDGAPNYVSGEQSGCESFTVGRATPKVATRVGDATTGEPWSGLETVGASAFDTATVTGVTGFAPTGSTSFTLYGDGTCTGTPVGTFPPATLRHGAVPWSTGPLGTGTHSFLANYAGDSNYGPAAAACEPFSVGRGRSVTSGTVYDVATHAPWSGAEHQGAAAYDTAVVRGVTGFTPTGKLTYTFFHDASCSGKPATSQTVSLVGGAAPASVSTGGLPSGIASFRGTYAGDPQYVGSATNCEAFGAQITGYRLQGGDGGLFAFHATFRGSIPPSVGLKIDKFVGMASASNGYWMVQLHGGIFTFGNAVYYGSLPAENIHVNDIVGIAATPDYKGYWLVSATGDVYAFGDAPNLGGVDRRGIVGIVSPPGTWGYWLVASNGGVYTFGGAHYRGSCAVKGYGCLGETNIVGMASTNSAGYWLVSSTGGVFTFGNEHFHGACPNAGAGCPAVHDVVGIAAPDAGGYWLAGADGHVYHFGDALFLGSEAGVDLERPIIAIS